MSDEYPVADVADQARSLGEVLEAGNSRRAPALAVRTVECADQAMVFTPVALRRSRIAVDLVDQYFPISPKQTRKGRVVVGRPGGARRGRGEEPTDPLAWPHWTQRRNIRTFRCRQLSQARFLEPEELLFISARCWHWDTRRRNSDDDRSAAAGSASFLSTFCAD